MSRARFLLIAVSSLGLPSCNSMLLGGSVDDAAAQSSDDGGTLSAPTGTTNATGGSPGGSIGTNANVGGAVSPSEDANGTPVSANDPDGGDFSAPSTGLSTTQIPLPCDVLLQTGGQCVAAHSTVRVIVAGYTGPLYELCKDGAIAGPRSCMGSALDIMPKDGYADVLTHDAFCSGSFSCNITKIYDQSGQKNDLEPAPAGGAKSTPDNPAVASALPMSIAGHNAYGVLIKPGMGYRTGCLSCTNRQATGMAHGDEPQSIYMVTSQLDAVNGCCFDYGNAETSSRDDGNGAVEAVNFGGGVVWGTGSGGRPGPWVMADLENGLFAGWENGQDQTISTNHPLKLDFVTAVLLGDTSEKNNGKGRFALYGGDAAAGALQTMYDGIRPQKPGYVPMTKQGSIVLGTAGDNSSADGGRFYEGAIAVGPVATKAQLDQLQTAIVAAQYGK